MNFSGNQIHYFPTVENGGGEENAGKPEKDNILTEIAGRICALWALILFVVTMLVFLIPFLLFSYFASDPKKTRRFISYSRVWMGVFLTGIGSPLRIKGKEKFRKGETYIVVFNHNSLMDVPISAPGVPGGSKTIAKTSFAKVPLFGMLYRTGSILVDRNSEASRRESFTRMKEVLDMGLHMCLYPEGTRNKTANPLKTFHNGAFRLALTTGKAIIPAIIFNSKTVLPPAKPFFVRPHKLGLHFLDPIAPQPGENVEHLKERVFRVMWDYYVTHKV
jgi:1-acyl-sn-glycerol-3-phosphate acyltransferase